jgi:iron(III) transport system ATP-binding protein
MASVELRGLTKAFDNHVAVDGVSLKIEHGLLVSLLGPSGCGKTTTLRLVAGFIEPTQGEIRVGERTVSVPGRVLPPERRNMSMIFQSYALWPHMTVAENVAYGLTLRKLDRVEVGKRVADILATARLSALAERYPSELSGGQQQRVSLARALVVEPETLLLDEPLSNLDANLREAMRFEIRRLHEAFRYTTIYVTHDQSEAMITADLIAVMNGGRIEQLGSPAEVYDRPVSEFVARFLGGSNILKGKARDAQHLEIAGTTIRGVGTAMRGGAEGVISIRQHEIAIEAAGPSAAGGGNALAGRVVRNVFLGAARDYAVELADGTQLRVTASPEIDLAEGSQVTLRLPEARCRILSN